jgi:glycosyltransferase involved in cell wall biosynthesis
MVHTTSAPLVSVVIPTYKRAHLIRRSVDSVRAQTVRDFELLVVDDGSGDETESVIAAIGDPRIRFLQRATNGGASAARNTGIDAARGTFVAFLDSDDAWLPHLLAHQLAMMDRLGAQYGMVHGGRIEVDGPGKEVISAVGTDLAGGLRSIEDLFIDNRIAPSCLVARRSVFETVGGLDEDLRSGEFFGVFIRMLEKGIGIGFTPEPLVRRYRQAGGNGTSPERDIRSFDTLRSRFAHVFERSRRLTTHYHVQRALLMLEARGRWAAVPDVVSAFRSGPPEAAVAVRIGTGLIGGIGAVQGVAKIRRVIRRELRKRDRDRAAPTD